MEIYLVTGANRGIGLALTRVLLGNGKIVIAGSRDPDAATDLKQLAAEYPDSVDLIKCDIANEEALRSAAEMVSKRRSKLDVIVNNGAIMPEQGNESILQIDLGLLSRAFDTNVLGQARVIRAFYPILIKSERPRIANVSSGYGSILEREGYDYYAYTTSKAALNMLTRSIAFEFGSKGVISVAISPGWVRTDMGGHDATLSAEDSARSLATTIEKLGPADNGQFLSREGKVGEYQW